MICLALGRSFSLPMPAAQMARRMLAGALSMALLLAVGVGVAGRATGQDAGLRLAPTFGSHMVLPPATNLPVSGFGEVGEAVTVSPSWGEPVATKVGSDGRWRVLLRTPVRGKAVGFTVASGGQSVAVADALVGDVWLASGQSNMEMPVAARGGLKGATDWEQEVRDADYPQLRVFTARRQASAAPSRQIEGEWVVCSPAVAGQISAVGYFFARDLVRAGKGPIGLVVSSWGGTKCEAWTSAQGLREFAEFGQQIEELQLAGDEASSQQAKRDAFFRAANGRVVISKGTEVAVPDRWSQSGLGDFDGVVDYVRRIQLPASFAGRVLRLELGAIDDMDIVYWNGQRIGGTVRDGAWSTPRSYTLAPEVTGRGMPRNVQLRIRVFDTGGEGGLTGKPESLRLRLAEPNGDEPLQSIPLAGKWQRTKRTALRELPRWPRAQGGPNRATVLWNGMIEPLLPFPFAGVIWYQGESNRGQPAQYARLFPAMIRDWRRAIGAEVPFYFVQIAPFGYRNDQGQTAQLRAAQAVALGLPKTGMVVTLDCGDARDIHPREKQAVGARLALLAREGHYGDDVSARGPRAASAALVESGVRVQFESGAGELELVHSGAGFEVAGSDGVFHPASAAVDGTELLLTCARQPAPTMVRYAWRAVPAWSLRNTAGLPAAPFELAVR